MGPTREKVPAFRWAVACASPEAPPASSVRRSSAGSARLGRATRWRRVHDDRATQWRRVVRTCTAQLRGRRGGRYQTTARRPRTSGLPARRCQHLTYRASTTHDSRSDWGTHLLRWRSETGDWLRGRALPSHGRGRWFKSSIAHQTNSRSE